MKIENLNREECEQMFKFGPSKRYVSKEMVELPMLVKMTNGAEEVLKVAAYVVDADVPFLLGKKTMEAWKSKVNMVDKVLETEMEGERKDFRMIVTESNHYGLEIEKEERQIDEVLFAIEKEEKLGTFKGMKKIHEVTNHKSAEQMIPVYRNAGLIKPDAVQKLKDMVRKCEICQKFGRSMARPKMTLQKAGEFNETVTLDLKEFGNK